MNQAIDIFVIVREFGIRKSLEKLWEWNVFSIFKGKNQQVT